MKICWDNLEGIRINSRGNFLTLNGRILYYYDECPNCGDPFLGRKNRRFCTPKCANESEKKGKKCSEETKKKMSISQKGHIVTEETKKKMSRAKKGKKLTEEHKENISKARIGIAFSEEHLKNMKIAQSKKSSPKRGEQCWNWGKYSSQDIPTYDKYALQLMPYEECRRQKEDPNILEVRCTLCRTWFTPEAFRVRNRIHGISKNDGSKFYCLDTCRNACPLYNKNASSLMKLDAIAAGRISLKELRNEVPAWIRDRVLELDDHTCQMCGSKDKQHVHHEIPQKRNQMLALDIDNCVSVCIPCHKWVHIQIDGCRYQELASLEIC